jgi:hypothetical protein
MKKITLAIGIVLIVALAGVWVYLLFFNTNNGNSDVFALFGFGDTTDESVPAFEGSYVNTDGAPVVDVASPQRLRQLTTKQTAGHRGVRLSASSSPLVYFAEAGTGHVYSIDLASGEETRLSNITVPTAIRASISKNGNYAAIQSGYGLESKLILITLPTTNNGLDSETLSGNFENFTFSANDTILYTNRIGDKTYGKEYIPQTSEVRTIFEIPFSQTFIDWGDAANSSHFVYPKASTHLQGYLYKISIGSMERLTPSGYGFSSVSNDNISLFSVQKDGRYQTFVENFVSQNRTNIPFPIIPEKCMSLDDKRDSIICAKTKFSSTNQLPDKWYSGEAEAKDTIMLINLSDSQPITLTDTYTESGREIDIVDLQLGLDENILLFKNKLDQTLWMFDWGKIQTYDEN